MSPARTNLRSALDRLMVATTLVAVALIAPRDAALAQSHIAVPPVKHPSVIDGPKRMLDAKPVLASPDRERDAKSLPARERCDEHGGCSGLIVSVGAPTPLRPVSFPIGAKPTPVSGGIWIGASGAIDHSDTAASGTGAGSRGGTSGAGAPVNSSSTRPQAPTKPGAVAPSTGNAPAGGTRPADGGGAIDE